MIVTGVVTSGLGHGTKATQLPWFRSVIEDRYGFVPVPGTLNLTHAKPMAELNALLLQAATVLVPPTADYCCALLIPAAILADPGPGGPGRTPPAPALTSVVLVRPLVPHYPGDQVELIAPVHLRTFLGVRDGDMLTVEVPRPSRPGGWIQARER